MLNQKSLLFRIIEEDNEEDEVEIYMKRLNQQNFFKPEKPKELLGLEKKVYPLQKFKFQILTRKNK